MKHRKDSQKFKMEFYSTAVGKSFGKGKWQGNRGLHTALPPPSKLSLWSLKNNQYRAVCGYTGWSSMFYYFLYADSKILWLFVQYSTLMASSLREIGNCFANMRDRNGIFENLGFILSGLLCILPRGRLFKDYGRCIL